MTGCRTSDSLHPQTITTQQANLTLRYTISTVSILSRCLDTRRRSMDASFKPRRSCRASFRSIWIIIPGIIWALVGIGVFLSGGLANIGLLGWEQTTVGNGTRSSSETSYLAPGYIDRKNLHVLIHSYVTRILTPNKTTSCHKPKFNTVEFTQDAGCKILPYPTASVS